MGAHVANVPALMSTNDVVGTMDGQGRGIAMDAPAAGPVTTPAHGDSAPGDREPHGVAADLSVDGGGAASQSHGVAAAEAGPPAVGTTNVVVTITDDLDLDAQLRSPKGGDAGGSDDDVSIADMSEGEADMYERDTALWTPPVDTATVQVARRGNVDFVNGYALVRRLGSGSFAHVWLAAPPHNRHGVVGGAMAVVGPPVAFRACAMARHCCADAGMCARRSSASTRPS